MRRFLIFKPNGNDKSIYKLWQSRPQCRFVQTKTKLEEPVISHAEQETSLTEPSPTAEKTLQNTENHAIPILNENKELHWLPPAFMLESRTKKTAAQKELEDEEWRNHLPPAPKYNLNMSDPVDRKTHQEIIDSLDKHLPKWDILRIPVWTSKPWFDYALWSYLAFVAAGVILLGDWDDMSEGEEHVFSGIRRWVFGTWHSLTSVPQEDVQQVFHQHLQGVQSTVEDKQGQDQASIEITSNIK